MYIKYRNMTANADMNTHILNIERHKLSFTFDN